MKIQLILPLLLLSFNSFSQESSLLEKLFPSERWILKKESFSAEELAKVTATWSLRIGELVLKAEEFRLLQRVEKDGTTSIVKYDTPLLGVGYRFGSIRFNVSGLDGTKKEFYAGLFPVEPYSDIRMNIWLDLDNNGQLSKSDSTADLTYCFPWEASIVGADVLFKNEGYTRDQSMIFRGYSLCDIPGKDEPSTENMENVFVIPLEFKHGKFDSFTGHFIIDKKSWKQIGVRIDFAEKIGNARSYLRETQAGQECGLLYPLGKSITGRAEDVWVPLIF